MTVTETKIATNKLRIKTYEVWDAVYDAEIWSKMDYSRVPVVPPAVAFLSFCYVDISFCSSDFSLRFFVSCMLHVTLLISMLFSL